MVLAHLFLAKLGGLLAAAYASFGVGVSIGVALAVYAFAGSLILLASVAVALWMAYRSETDISNVTVPELA